MLCTKQCEFDAIKVENNIAHIDQTKCTGCGKCAEKCPKRLLSSKMLNQQKVIHRNKKLSAMFV